MENFKSYRKIEAEYLVEILAEKFSFFPIDALIENGRALIYGGALRDTLAGLPLNGDLDIVTSNEFFTRLVNSFESSPKWLQIQPNRLPKPSRLNKVHKMLDLPQATTGYKNCNVPLSAIVTFQGVSGYSVDIICAKPALDEEDPVISVVKSVDLICCGLAMNREGELFEVIQGAEEDCKNRILRINGNVIKDLDMERVIKRIHRLEENGWKSEINIEKLTKENKRLVAKEKKKRGQENPKRATFAPKFIPKQINTSVQDSKIDFNKIDFSKIKIYNPYADAKSEVNKLKKKVAALKHQYEIVLNDDTADQNVKDVLQKTYEDAQMELLDRLTNPKKYPPVPKAMRKKYKPLELCAASTAIPIRESEKAVSSSHIGYVNSCSTKSFYNYSAVDEYEPVDEQLELDEETCIPPDKKSEPKQVIIDDVDFPDPDDFGKLLLKNKTAKSDD